MRKQLAVALAAALLAGLMTLRPGGAGAVRPAASSTVLAQGTPGVQLLPGAPTISTASDNAVSLVLSAVVGAAAAAAATPIALAPFRAGADGPTPPGVLPVVTAPGSPEGVPPGGDSSAEAATAGGGAAGPVIQTGLATWYGPGFNGGVTYCGEIFDQWAMTAASNTLPCGTVVVVTNLNNGRSVRLRINDRGGFGGAVILDLSQGAFVALGGPPAGTIPVSVQLAQ
jgi:hypothetical protein